MTIRLANEGDIPFVRDCATAAYEMYVERMGRKPAPMVADFTGILAAQNLYVLETEQGLAGFIVFYPRDDHVHIENVAVDPAFQGKGYGTRLIEFAEGKAREQGFSRAELYTNEKMTENIAYYPKLGYEEIGRWEEDGFNRVFYRKEL